MAPLRSRMAMIMDEIENPTFNEMNNTKSSFIEPDSLNVVVLLTSVYGIIFLMGVLGNIITCIVIRRHRILHTATNFYLFCLAISDLLLLICGLPLEVYRLWKPNSYPLKESLCIMLGLISETSVNVTVLTIAALTVERYVAIYHPFKLHKLFKLSRVVKHIFAIWICSLCSALPQVMQFGIVIYEENGRMLSACTVKGLGVHQVFVISSFIFFVIPSSLITVLYVLIGIKMRTSRVLRPVRNSSVRNVERSDSIRRCRKGAAQRKVIRMLVAVTLSFFLCWAPFHVQRLIAIYGKNLEHPTDTFNKALCSEVLADEVTSNSYFDILCSLTLVPVLLFLLLFVKVYVFLTYLSGVLYYVSTLINPILYNIMSKRFRNAFKVTLLSWCKRRDGLDNTSRAILANLRGRAVARTLYRSCNPPLHRPRSTGSSQQRSVLEVEVPPQAQSPDRNTLAIIYEENESELSSTSPQISNSSLREIDQELSCEELTTYLYQVNSEITRKIFESYV